MTAPYSQRQARPAPGERVYTPTMQDLEARVGIESLDVLLAKRAELIDQCATLRAKYSAWGTAEALRKIEVSRLKSLVRAQALRDKRKVNNEQVDEEAHGHPDYLQHVTQMTLDRAAWVRAENAIEAIDSTIMRGTALIRFAGNEARL